MGEPAGIGAEIALAAWRRRLEPAVPPFVLLDDADRVEALAADLGWTVPIARVMQASEALAVFADALPVLHRPLPVRVRPGHPDPVNAGAVRDAIAEAVALVTGGDCAAVVTNPINKDVLQGAGFPFPGHTEFLADLAGERSRAVMMLACDALRVVPVTIHLPLARVSSALTTDGIVQAGRITARALARDFGIAAPRLAVAGLNPHAGEHGRMGDEEGRVIQPAVDVLRAEGVTVSDPAPADTLFHAGARARYDAVLCMYHDQALIPLKTIDFAGGVNVTLGLPFVRTSPDHGTAFDIAGQGRADPTSLIAALRMAADMAARRAAASTP
jgi:4-hydroxythreonine-4-phosphate dehydrogenase